MKSFLAIGVISLAGLGFSVWGIGMLLPSQVTASRSAELKASPARVFQTVTNIEEQTQWRKDIASVRVHSSGKSWTEETTAGTIIDFEVLHKEPKTRFEIKFVSKQGFSGSWVGVFTPSSNGTMVQITETIEIQNPIFRVMSRIFRFTDKFIDTYLAQLKEAVES
jgi:uncharacterized protein YndB with AHSA1/START domain